MASRTCSNYRYTDLKLFNKKIIPSVQPTHATSDMYWAKDRLGEKRLEGAYAYKVLLENSGTIRWVLIFQLRKLVQFQHFFQQLLGKIRFLPKGGFLPENKLSRMDALRGMTIWGARQF